MLLEELCDSTIYGHAAAAAAATDDDDDDDEPI